MPGRMSNRDRIARMAAEKAAEKKAKEAAKGKKKTRSATSKATAKKATRTTSKTSAAKPAGGIKMVWAVCDNTGATVKTYPYAERKSADAEAARLTTSKGKTHFVKYDKVPME